MWATLTPDAIARLPERMVNGAMPSTPGAAADARVVEAKGWKACIDALLDIRMLEDDWDGQGTPAPPPEVVDSAIVLAVLLRQRHVLPPNVTVQGVTRSVLMEWQWPDKTSIEIEVIDPGVADVYLMIPDQKVQYWQVRGSGD
ncbi:MAG TPA: hypothetical protein VH092_00960 [Urbifossiella sp.]|jgi:hypothetical protein|nr:hypothetical protein [Urbifossiella sp.]